jgi:hypothetical protein
MGPGLVEDLRPSERGVNIVAKLGTRVTLPQDAIEARALSKRAEPTDQAGPLSD